MREFAQIVSDLQKLPETQQKIAWALAEGKNQKQAAEIAGCSADWVSQLMRMPQFAHFKSLVDELTMVTGIAVSGERLRVAKAAIEQAIANGKVKTKEDVLRWLEYVGKLVEGPEGSTKVKVSWEEPKTMEELLGELEK